MPMTTGRELLSAGIHAAGLSAAISSAAAAGLVGENIDKSKRMLKASLTLRLQSICMEKPFYCNKHALMLALISLYLNKRKCINRA